MSNIIQRLEELSDKIWGKNFEVLDKKDEVISVHFSELGDYL